MFGAKIKWCMVTTFVVSTILLTGAGVASAATDYAKSPPEFDRIMMLRVAQLYNLSPAVNLSFPATTRGACIIAGISVQTHIVRDHNAWTNTADADAYRTSIQESGGGRAGPCLWLKSDAADASVPGVSKVWTSATLKPNFKRLRKGLRKANCKAVYKALDRYPSVILPKDKIRRIVFVAMGRHCKKQGRGK